MNAVPEKKLNLNMFGAIYFAIFCISVILNEQGRYLKFPKLDEKFWPTMQADLFFGVFMGSVIVLVTWVLTKHVASFRELGRNFNALLGNLSSLEIFFIAAFSSIAEEFFFRGLIQGNFGIFFASLLFGILHTGPGKKYIPWTVFAVSMGFVLGGLYAWCNNIAVPVVIHFVVNFGNLHLMKKIDPAPEA